MKIEVSEWMGINTGIKGINVDIEYNSLIRIDFKKEKRYQMKGDIIAREIFHVQEIVLEEAEYRDIIKKRRNEKISELLGEQ